MKRPVAQVARRVAAGDELARTLDDAARERARLWKARVEVRAQGLYIAREAGDPLGQVGRPGRRSAVAQQRPIGG